MHCLLCGRKLAIFRKSALGDFCCAEHRALYLEEQEELGVARLMGSAPGKPKTVPAAAPQGRLMLAPAGFLAETAQASSSPSPARGYFHPIRPDVHLASLRLLDLAEPGRRLAPMVRESLVALEPEPVVPMEAGPLAFRPWLPLSLDTLQAPALSPAGLMQPWSMAAGEHFTLSPLVAAAWAREGAAEPIPAPLDFDFTLAFAWPALNVPVEFRTEIPSEALEIEMPVDAADTAPLEAPPGMAMPAMAMPAAALPPAIGAAFHESTADFEPAPLPRPRLAKPEGPRTLPRPFQMSPLLDAEPSLVNSARAARKLQPRRSNRDEFYELSDIAQGARGQKGEGFGWRQLVYVAGAPTMVGLCSALFLVLSAAALISVPRAGSSRSGGGGSLFAGSGGPSSFRLENLRSAIRGRAALRLDEDFRAGLSGWSGSEGWSKDWSYDQAGFLRPGKIGLFKNSMNLTNYRMEFMGQIERKSLGWVFRAADAENFYAAKITITKPGPLPAAELVRFAVTAGQAGPRLSVPLPFPIRNDTIYNIQLDVKGDSFAARVNGQMVDAWSDARFRMGGVGFMSEAGDLARVRWLRVSDRDDFLGRICSYLTAQAFVPGDGVLSASTYQAFVVPEL